MSQSGTELFTRQKNIHNQPYYHNPNNNNNNNDYAYIGINHIKGILLYGPPGTGKTLIARELAKALNSREPLLVNGPEIMDKYVGEAERNIRDLFKPAEEEWAMKGAQSELHVIIFDEFDSVAKKRGSLSGTYVRAQPVYLFRHLVDYLFVHLYIQ